MARHSALTDPALHECKGASTAPAGYVMTANGDGTAAFQSAASVASGAVIKTLFFPVSTSSTGTTTTPFDDTIPQVTEGTEFLTASFTPTTSGNTIRVEAVVIGSYSVAAKVIAALHVNAGADAVASSMETTGAVNETTIHRISYEMTAPSTSAIAFTVRVGGSTAGTYTLNGNNGARVLGGTLISAITVTETKA